MTVTYDFEAELASASGEYELEAPLATVLGEAEDAAKFATAYWSPIEEDNEDGEEPRPGLALVGPLLPRRFIGEIRELIPLVSEADAAALLAVGSRKDVETFQEGLLVARELRLVLELVINNDGVDDEKDDQLAALRKQHHDAPATADALALKIDHYAAMARKHRKLLAKVGGFDLGHIDDAPGISKRLRAIPNSATAALNPERSGAFTRRNKLLNLLSRRVTAIRAGARYAFRDDAGLARLAASTHERLERRARKNAQAAKEIEEAVAKELAAKEARAKEKKPE